MSPPKKKWFYVCLVAVLFSLFACKKSIETESNPSIEKVLRSYVQGRQLGIADYILLKHSQVATTNTGSRELFVAGLLSEGGQNVSGGNLLIGSKSISPAYNFSYSNTYTGADSTQLLSAFGDSTLQIGFSGSADVAAYRSAPIRLPGVIYPITILLPSNSISKSTNFTLNWAPDAALVDAKMYIQVYYYKGLSQLNNPNFPNEIASIFYVVNDNLGAYTLTIRDFANFPVNGYLGISMSRGYGTVHTIYKKGRPTNLYSLAVVDAAKPPLIITP